MSQLIPMAVETEKANVKSSLSDEDVSIIFDGSTRLGEALAVILRDSYYRALS